MLDIPRFTDSMSFASDMSGHTKKAFHAREYGPNLL